MRSIALLKADSSSSVMAPRNGIRVANNRLANRGTFVMKKSRHVLWIAVSQFATLLFGSASRLQPVQEVPAHKITPVVSTNRFGYEGINPNRGNIR